MKKISTPIDNASTWLVWRLLNIFGKRPVRSRMQGVVGFLLPISYILYARTQPREISLSRFHPRHSVVIPGPPSPAPPKNPPSIAIHLILKKNIFKLYIPCRSCHKPFFLRVRETVWTRATPYLTVIRVFENGVISNHEV